MTGSVRRRIKLLRKYFFIVFLLLFGVVACATKSSNTYNFNGNEIFDSKSGVLIRASEKRDVIFVQNKNYRYMVPLPYSDNWTITYDENKPLFATDNKYGNTVSLQIHPITKVSPVEYYQNLLDNFKIDKNLKIDSNNIINASGFAMLKYK